MQNVARGVDVAMRFVSARRTVMPALPECLSYRRHVLARRTGLARAPGIHRDQRPTGTRSLVREDREELSPSGIRHALGEHAALEPNDIQVFDRNQVVLLHEPQRGLVVKVPPSALDRAMPPGQTAYRPLATGAPTGALRDHALGLSQSRACDPPWSRVREVLTITRREEGLQAEVDPDGGICARKEALWDIVTGEENKPVAARIAFEREGFTRPSNSLDQNNRTLPMPCNVSVRFLPDVETGPSDHPACLNVSES